MYLVIAEKPSVSSKLCGGWRCFKNAPVVIFCSADYPEKTGTGWSGREKGAVLRFKKALKPPGYPVCRECL